MHFVFLACRDVGKIRTNFKWSIIPGTVNVILKFINIIFFYSFLYRLKHFINALLTLVIIICKYKIPVVLACSGGRIFMLWLETNSPFIMGLDTSQIFWISRLGGKDCLSNICWQLAGTVFFVYFFNYLLAISIIMLFSQHRDLGPIETFPFLVSSSNLGNF